MLVPKSDKFNIELISHNTQPIFSQFKETEEHFEINQYFRIYSNF